MYNSNITTTPKQTTEQREYLNLSSTEWLWPLAALLCMSMIGLAFPLGYLGILVILINRFRQDRYDFLIIISIWFGGYAFTGSDSYIYFKSSDVAIVIAFIGVLLLKKRGIILKTLVAYFVYILSLLVFAYISEEKMTVQLYIWRNYILFIYFIIPLMVFANRPFEIKLFFRRLLPYALIICIFYIIDSAIFSGNVLIPNSAGYASRFYDLYWQPFSFNFVRKYPPGLFWLALCIFPVIKYYKLRPWQWCVILLALAVSRTFTIISGLIIIFIASQSKPKIVILSVLGVIVAATMIYTIDASLPKKENGESPLRIASSIDQIIDLADAADDVDLAEAGSGRIGQALPKLELLNTYHRQWIGFGFLHPQLTKNPRYIIFNEYYNDIEQAEEVTTGIEVEVLQVIINVGYIGLIIFFLFYGYTCFLVRKNPYAKFFYIVVACMLWFGIGGFGSLSQPMGLILAGLSYSVVILAYRTEQMQANKIETSTDKIQLSNV